MSRIPDEIYFEILLKVPVKSLLACKCVCKTWFSLISSPNFVKMHHKLTIQRNKPALMFAADSRNRDQVLYSVRHDSLESFLSTDHQFLDYVVELDYPFKSVLKYSLCSILEEEELVNIMGCCEGLVCLRFEEKGFFCLWNPATREYKVLPKSKIRYNVYKVAFGYDHKSNDYKLLVASGGLFEVYSLALNLWKSVENASFNKFHYWNTESSGVVVNGDLHWLEKRRDSSNKVVVSLDISNEIFRGMEPPKETFQNDHILSSLGLLEGCLCLIEDLDDNTKIWVMQNYGVQESWTNRYIVNKGRISSDASLRLMLSFKSGEILFVNIDNDGLVVYNPETGSVRETKISGVGNLYHDDGPYFESLVSLKSSTYVGEEVEEEVKEWNDCKSSWQWE